MAHVCVNCGGCLLPPRYVVRHLSFSAWPSQANSAIDSLSSLVLPSSLVPSASLVGKPHNTRSATGLSRSATSRSFFPATSFRRCHSRQSQPGCVGRRCFVKRTRGTRLKCSVTALFSSALSHPSAPCRIDGLRFATYPAPGVKPAGTRPGHAFSTSAKSKPLALNESRERRDSGRCPLPGHEDFVRKAQEAEEGRFAGREGRRKPSGLCSDFRPTPSGGEEKTSVSLGGTGENDCSLGCLSAPRQRRRSRSRHPARRRRYAARLPGGVDRERTAAWLLRRRGDPGHNFAMRNPVLDPSAPLPQLQAGSPECGKLAQVVRVQLREAGEDRSAAEEEVQDQSGAQVDEYGGVFTHDSGRAALRAHGEAGAVSSSLFSSEVSFSSSRHSSSGADRLVYVSHPSGLRLPSSGRPSKTGSVAYADSSLTSSRSSFSCASADAPCESPVPSTCGVDFSVSCAFSSTSSHTPDSTPSSSGVPPVKCNASSSSSANSGSSLPAPPHLTPPEVSCSAPSSFSCPDATDRGGKLKKAAPTRAQVMQSLTEEDVENFPRYEKPFVDFMWCDVKGGNGGKFKKNAVRYVVIVG